MRLLLVSRFATGRLRKTRNSRSGATFLTLLAGAAAPIVLLTAQNTNFPDPPRPPGLPNPSHVFQLGQNYPKTLRLQGGRLPWTRYDFQKQPLDYLKSVLGYVLEGNVGSGIAPDQEWPGTGNKVRPWYNVPWANREYIHGLTQERTAQCGQLLANQTVRISSWGLAFYNEPGGLLVGKVFPNTTTYNTAGITFPDGTVAIKLLFTTGTPAQIPFLQNTREWDAFLQANPSPAVDQPGCPASPPPCKASGPGCLCATSGGVTSCVQKVRLLQLDVAVKDARANTTTGWVFGTFVYNGNLPGSTPYDRLKPIGVAWGSMQAPGQLLPQQALFSNSPVIMPGFGGRLNGIIDDPTMWCLGCHSTSESEPPDPALTAQQILALGNLRGGVPITPGEASLDYSLSIYDAIFNFLQKKQSTGPQPDTGPPGTVVGPTGKHIKPIRR